MPLFWAHYASENDEFILNNATRGLFGKKYGYTLPMMNSSSVKIKKGYFLVYRIFDVAEEINMSQIEVILRDSRGPDRFKVPKYIDRALVMRNPPISFGLGEEIFHLNGKEAKAEVLVKVRDFGGLTILYQIPIEPGTDWDQLIHLASELEESTEIDTMAQQQAREVAGAISSAMKKPNMWSAFEDYIVYFIEEFEEDLLPNELLERVDIASLLLAETNTKISESTRKGLLEQVFQYSERDMTILVWNSALVVEPGGGREVPDILEFAVTQLMEMRFYDELLDNKLGVLYDDIEKKRNSIWSTRYDQAYADASARYIEFIEFLERVENSLKVVGDFYLAIIYRAATRRFRMSDWQNNITRKMNILAQVSNLLQGEINMRKSHVMEITIILLIAYEIVSAFWSR